MIPDALDVILTAAVHIDDRGRILAIGGVHHDLPRDRQMDMDDESHAGTDTFVSSDPGQSLGISVRKLDSPRIFFISIHLVKTSATKPRQRHTGILAA